MNSLRIYKFQRAKYDVIDEVNIFTGFTRHAHFVYASLSLFRFAVLRSFEQCLIMLSHKKDENKKTNVYGWNEFLLKRD